MPCFVGLDWASTAHAVCVIDEQGHIQWQGIIPHSAAGLAECVRRLHSFGPPAALRIAIERPSGWWSTRSWTPAPGDPGASQRRQGQPGPLPHRRG